MKKTASHHKLLKMLAVKYIWWKSPEDALKFPERVIAQVMELGDYEDVQILVNEIGDGALKNILRHPQPGVFSAKSWAYWHYRLGLAQAGKVPDLPKRKIE